MKNYVKKLIPVPVVLAYKSNIVILESITIAGHVIIFSFYPGFKK